MATWNDVISNPQFKNETIETQNAIAEDFFEKVIAPQVKANGDDVEAVWADFYSKARQSFNKPDGNIETQPEAPQETSEAVIEQSDIITQPEQKSHQDASGAIGDITGDITGNIKEAGKGLLQTGANVVNAVPELADIFSSAAAWAGNKVGIGDGTYQKAPRVELSEDLKPTKTSTKLAADIAPMFLGGGSTAAPRLARTVVAGLSGSTDGQTSGEQAADLAAVATMPLGNKGKIARVLAENAGIGLGVEGVSQLVDGKFDAGDLALSAGLSGILGAAGKKLSDGVGALVNRSNDKEIIKAVDIERRKPTTDKSEGALPEVIPNPKSDASDLVQAIRGMDDVQAENFASNAGGFERMNKWSREGNELKATPRQVFGDESAQGRFERSGFVDTSELEKRYRDMARFEDAFIADDAKIAKRFEDDFKTTPRNFLNEIGSDTQDKVFKRVSQQYTDDISAAQKVMDDNNIKAIKLPSARQVAAQITSIKDTGAPSALSPKIKDHINKIASANYKSVKELDDAKRLINGKKADYVNTNKEAYDAYSRLGDALKSDAANVLGINPWKTNDAHFAQYKQDFASGNPMAKLLGGEDGTQFKQFYAENGPRRINDFMTFLQKESPEDLNATKRAILNGAYARAREKAFNNNAGRLNYGAFRKEMEKLTPIIKELDKFKTNGKNSLADNQAETWNATTKAMGLLRQSDLQRFQKNMGIADAITAGGLGLAGLGIGQALGGDGLGLGGALAAGRLGYKASKQAIERRAAKKTGEALLRQTDAVTESANSFNEIRKLIKDMESSNKLKASNAALEYMEKYGQFIGREVADEIVE